MCIFSTSFCNGWCISSSKLYGTSLSFLYRYFSPWQPCEKNVVQLSRCNCPTAARDVLLIFFSGITVQSLFLCPINHNQGQVTLGFLIFFCKQQLIILVMPALPSCRVGQIWGRQQLTMVVGFLAPRLSATHLLIAFLLTVSVFVSEDIFSSGVDAWPSTDFA